MKKSICLFDMDGTLTEPRKNIQQSMLDKLMELTDCVDIGIVTGSDMDYVEQQCKSMLTDNEFGSKLKAKNVIKSIRLQKLYKEYNKRT